MTAFERAVPWTASPRAGGRPSLVAAALAAAEAWLLDPARPAHADAGPPAPADRPLVVVCGLARGCGTTTIARALAVELAARDPLRSAVAAGGGLRGAVPLATAAAVRLTRLVADRTGVEARASGRLCIAASGQRLLADGALRDAAPLVLEAAPEAASQPVSRADHVVLVATPRHEPALAELVARSLARAGPEPLLVLNRVGADGGDAPRGDGRDDRAPRGDGDDRAPRGHGGDDHAPRGDGVNDAPDPPRGHAANDAPGPPHDHRPHAGCGSPGWGRRAHVAVPASAAAARLALAGRRAGGPFAEAVARIADRCLEP